MLKIENLTKMFGGLAAVKDVSVEFEANQVNRDHRPQRGRQEHLFNLVGGAQKPSSGRIIPRRGGHHDAALRPHRQAGVGRTFQTTNLFDQASVLDNLIVGHRLRTRSGLWDVLTNSRRLQREEKLSRDRAREALDFVGLSHVENRFIADITQEESGWLSPWHWRRSPRSCSSTSRQLESTPRRRRGWLG